MFGIIGLLVVVTAYSALNLENRSDVSLGVYTFRGVPVFLTSLIALILGAVLAVPLTLRRAGRRHNVGTATATADDGELTEEPLPDEPEPALPGVSPEPEQPAGEPEPEEAPRRRRRWPFGARNQDQDPDEAHGRDRDTGGGG